MNFKVSIQWKRKVLLIKSFVEFTAALIYTVDN